MNSEDNTFTGIWRSHYKYPSSARDAEFENEHTVRVHQEGNQLIVESIPEADKSYLFVRLSLQDNIATGNWHEETEQDGYYKGAVYYGAIQLVVSEDKKRMEGKWVGFGKDMKVNVGPWDFTYVGPELPAGQ